MPRYPGDQVFQVAAAPEEAGGRQQEQRVAHAPLRGAEGNARCRTGLALPLGWLPAQKEPGPGARRWVQGQRDNPDLGEGSPSVHTRALPEPPLGQGTSKVIRPTKSSA